jgi:chorismate mutase
VRELEGLRKEIEEVTLKIFRLIGQRLALARKVGRVKRQLALPYRDPTVENRLREKVAAICQEEGIPEELGHRFLDLLLESSLNAQLGEGER